MFLSNGQTVPSAAVEVLADRTPVFADQSYYASNALSLLNTYAAYAAIYKTQLWVQVLVKKLAAASTLVPFEVKLRLSDTDSKAESGPLADLLARPNLNMSGLKLREWTTSTREVYGEAFWLKLRDRSGRVRELHPMHPTNVIIRRQPDGTVGYVYTNGSANTSELPTIPQQDVVSFTNYNPDNLLRGLSSLEALRMTLLNEDASRRATASMWAKGARPAVMLATDRSLTAGATQRLKAQFDAAHAGADNTGSTVVFEEGVKPTIVQLNSEEMQYIESRKLNREEVCAAYDVPPPAVHILDHATFSNITEQLRSLYRDTMAPRFVNFESVIDHQLVPDFYPTRGDVFTRFDMEGILRGDFETKAAAATLLRNSGVGTGNEVRTMFGLPKSDDPYMDQIFSNAALIPLGSAQERITLTDPLNATPNDLGELVSTPVPAHPRDPLPTGVNTPKPLPAAPSTPRATAGPNVRTFMGQLGRARQQGATVKTWHVNGDCKSHTALDGETVPIGDVFSNSARVPGDETYIDPDCACSVSFRQEN